MSDDTQIWDLDPHGDLSTAEINRPLTETQWKLVKLRVATALDRVTDQAESTAGNDIGATVHEILGLLAAHFRR